MWTDIHAHLYDLTDRELRAQLLDARRNAVTTVINASTNIASANRVIEQASSHPSLHAAVGISAFDVDGLAGDWAERIEELLSCEKVVAVGEIGLDDTNPRYPALSRQVPVFERQLEIAVRKKLPAVIHSRGAEERAIQTCIDAHVRCAVFHCFTGPVRTLEKLLDAGYYVSFSGIVTFAKQHGAGLVQAAPPDRLFVETDSPYLAPFPHRGEPNRPAYLALVGRHVAAEKGLSPEQLAARIASNVSTVFGIQTHCAPSDA